MNLDIMKAERDIELAKYDIQSDLAVEDCTPTQKALYEAQASLHRAKAAQMTISIDAQEASIRHQAESKRLSELRAAQRTAELKEAADKAAKSRAQLGY